MKTLFPAFLLCVSTAVALSPTDRESAAEAKPTLQLRILDSQEVDFGNWSIFYNRIETPVLKPRPEPVSIEPARPPTAEELAEMQEWESKSISPLFLSSTVYDHEVTYVRWWREDDEYILWSSIDFNYLRGLFTFETEATRYSFFLGIGDESRKQVEEQNAELQRDPELREYRMDLGQPLPPDRIPDATDARSAYQFVSVPKTGLDPKVKTALDDLHRYFDTNREQLIREFKASETARIAQEQWAREHPPVPKDSVINYFPIRSVANERSAKGGLK